MPIFEYLCNKCDNSFELLVYGDKKEILCPKCNSKDTKKKLSLFGVNGVDNPVQSSSSGCSSCGKSSCSTC
ncbi:FmdB family regulatory protein [Candidatus Magnetoovum chiemensis]|nr:FmdB family regulatory protein [Candidatus Magnetoovum chiemensis]